MWFAEVKKKEKKRSKHDPDFLFLLSDNNVPQDEGVLSVFWL